MFSLRVYFCQRTFKTATNLSVGVTDMRHRMVLNVKKRYRLRFSSHFFLSYMNHFRGSLC